MSADTPRVGTVVPAGSPIGASPEGGGVAIPASSLVERMDIVIVGVKKREERWRMAAREVLTPKRDGDHLVCRFCESWAQLGEAVKHRSDCATQKLRSLLEEPSP